MKKLNRQKLQKKIDETGTTVFAFAKKYGFTYESLRRWLNGEREAKISNISKLADALGCSADDISDFVFEYTGEGIAELEADREEICGIFGNLSKEQRKSIINMAQLIANANKTIEQ